eukprot:3351479-Rhodomonas_salina.1
MVSEAHLSLFDDALCAASLPCGCDAVPCVSCVHLQKFAGSSCLGWGSSASGRAAPFSTISKVIVQADVFVVLQAAAPRVPETQDITRIERIGANPASLICHAKCPLQDEDADTALWVQAHTPTSVASVWMMRLRLAWSHRCVQSLCLEVMAPLSLLSHSCFRSRATKRPHSAVRSKLTTDVSRRVWWGRRTQGGQQA